MNTQPDSRAADIAQAERLEAVFDAFYQEWAQAHGITSDLRRSFMVREVERCTPAAAALICKLAQERDGLTALLGSEPLRAARDMARLLSNLEVESSGSLSDRHAKELLYSYRDCIRLLLSHLPLVGLHDA